MQVPIVVSEITFFELNGKKVKEESGDPRFNLNIEVIEGTYLLTADREIFPKRNGHVWDKKREKIFIISGSISIHKEPSSTDFEFEFSTNVLKFHVTPPRKSFYIKDSFCDFEQFIRNLKFISNQVGQTNTKEKKKNNQNALLISNPVIPYRQIFSHVWQLIYENLINSEFNSLLEIYCYIEEHRPSFDRYKFTFIDTFTHETLNNSKEKVLFDFSVKNPFEIRWEQIDINELVQVHYALLKFLTLNQKLELFGPNEYVKTIEKDVLSILHKFLELLTELNLFQVRKKNAIGQFLEEMVKIKQITNEEFKSIQKSFLKPEDERSSDSDEEK